MWRMCGRAAGARWRAVPAESVAAGARRAPTEARAYRLHPYALVYALEIQAKHQFGEPASQPAGAGPLTYVFHAFTHPLHVLVFVPLIVGALASTAWLLFAVLPAIELLFIAAIARSRGFRASVDRELTECRARDLERQREQWMAMMGERHQHELKLLSLLVRSMRDRADGYHSAHLVLDRHLDLDGMLAAYAQLAIRYHEAERCLLLTFGDIDGELSRLRDDAPLGLLRRDILERRRRLRERVRGRLDEVESQLQAISGAIRLAHEHGLLMDHERDAVRERLDDFLDRLSGMTESLAELRDLDKAAA